MHLNRRHFLGTGMAASALLTAPTVWGQAKPKVVVIGGGAGGATAARYLAKDSGGAIEVTLVEANPVYTTCFFSNLYLGGFRDFESLQHNYDKLAGGGVTVINDMATGVDRAAKTVTLAGGQVLPYDRLILSPGIDFKDGSVPGWSLDAAEKMPHAYKAGPQTQLLKKMVEEMPEGGVFAMIAPPNPYRCPPGPYERISMIAHVLKEKNPTAKIIVADPKEKFSKQALFEEGWNKHYAGMVEWIGPDFGGGKVEVRPDTMEVVIDGEVTKVDCCNVIPGQMAGKIAALAGVTDELELGAGRSGDDEGQGGRERLGAGRQLGAGRHAQVGVLGQQSGQGRRHDDPGRTDGVQDLPGQIFQHLLVADRAGRRGEGRRLL